MNTDFTAAPFSAELVQSCPTVVRLLTAQLQRNRLAHAYLWLSANQPLKGKLLRELAQILNCSAQPEGTSWARPCGQCANCQWIATEAHPEVPITLEPQSESKKGIIRLKEAQALLNRLQRSSAYYRVLLIKTAEQEFLGREAANALLKTLEESRPRTLFVLWAQDAELVLPTVVSRCQLLHFPAEQTQPTQAPTLPAELQELLQGRQTPRYLQLSQLAEKIDEGTLLALLDYCQKQLAQSGTGLWFVRLQQVEQALRRLRAFCNQRAVCEELLYVLTRTG